MNKTTVQESTTYLYNGKAGQFNTFEANLQIAAEQLGLYNKFIRPECEEDKESIPPTPAFKRVPAPRLILAKLPTIPEEKNADYRIRLANRTENTPESIKEVREYSESEEKACSLHQKTIDAGRRGRSPSLLQSG
jgi:hypothetical protein